MGSSRCASSTARALYKVFITPVEQSQAQIHHRPAVLSRIKSTSPSLFVQQRRNYAIVATRGPGTGPIAKLDRLPRNEEITAWQVQVVDADNKLSEPRNTRSILASLNLKEFALCVVQEGSHDTPPLCKIMNKKDLYNRAKEKRKAKAVKNPSSVTKEIELNWAVEANDLQHRLASLKSFLQKGYKVEIMCAGRKKKQKTARQATAEEAEALLRKIREAIGEVIGAKETQPMQGKVLASATIFAEGKAPKKVKPVAEDVENIVES